MQPAEFSRSQHQVCCHLLDSACWVPILLSLDTGARTAPLWIDCKISTQPAESNRWQHTGWCTPLDSAGCIPMHPVGFRLTNLYYVDVLIWVITVYNFNFEFKFEIEFKFTRACKYLSATVPVLLVVLKIKAKVWKIPSPSKNLQNPSKTRQQVSKNIQKHRNCLKSFENVHNA